MSFFAFLSLFILLYASNPTKATTTNSKIRRLVLFVLLIWENFKYWFNIRKDKSYRKRFKGAANLTNRERISILGQMFYVSGCKSK